MLRIVFATIFCTLAGAAYATCERTLAIDEPKLATIVQQAPGTIGAKSVDVVVVKAIGAHTTAAIGPPTAWNMADARGMLWLMTPQFTILFVYNTENCFIGSAKIDGQVIVDALKEVSDAQPHLEPNDLPYSKSLRYGPGNYLRLI